eukprot:gene3064-6006_t
MREEINVIFFKSLDSKDPELSNSLMIEKPHNLLSQFFHALMGYLSMIPISLLILILYNTPIIGKFLSQHRVLITGFCFPYLLLSTIPYIGPWAFLCAQAAAADLLCEIRNETDAKELSTSIWNCNSNNINDKKSH